jgi:hypothetical protein
MSPRHTQDVRDLLLEVNDLLESVGETWWSEKAKKMARRDDPSFSSDWVLSWFGGMGSFSDLLLCRTNGHSGTEEELSAKNVQLGLLRSQLYAACLNEGS